MKRVLTLLAAAGSLLVAAPSITELQPRGAQKGRPFTLTVVGRELGEGATIVSSLPATFTPLAPEKPGMGNRYATYLVEPTAEWAVGVYPVRVQAANGVSNILLFSIGAFPELTEEESRPGALPNQNDSIERAQTLPSTPLTLNGTLRGAERDVYRVEVKAGERRVFEIDARRCGSAVDPVIQIRDGAGRLLARSEDDPLLSLDPRVDMTFPKEGFYYVEVFDARFSAQSQNYYRLKTGAYTYAAGVFPLGGRRGEQVEVNVATAGAPVKVKADLQQVKGPQTFVNAPESPALPLPFAVGEYPEITEPAPGPLTLPVTVNGRLSKAGEIDRYELAVKAGEQFFFELQARELGTSKLTGLITVWDDKGKRLASAGDGPLPVDVAAVQASSRTLGDPYLQFEVPAGVTKITVGVEDLARRGGAHYAYRLTAYRSPYDFQAMVLTPFVNIPAGGTALVTVAVQRRGFTGAIRVEPVNLPAGVTAVEGLIPVETPDPNNRMAGRRAVVTLTASSEARFASSELQFRAVGTLEKGGTLERMATNVGYLIPVNGATEQGVVDRQRALGGNWLGYPTLAALTDVGPATLTLTLEKASKKEAGYEFKFRWRWSPRDPAMAVPSRVSVDVPGFADFRAIEMAADHGDPATGTFVVTSTRNTLPARYNVSVRGSLMVDGAAQDIYAPALLLDVPALDPEEKNANASTAAAR